MLKKFLLVFLSIILILALIGCDDDSGRSRSSKKKSAFSGLTGTTKEETETQIDESLENALSEDIQQDTSKEESTETTVEEEEKEEEEEVKAPTTELPAERDDVSSQATPSVNTDALMLNVLLGTQPIYDQYGYPSTLNAYLTNEYFSGTPTAYCFVDFDADGVNEMVVETTSEIDTFVVLHYYEQNVFATSFGVRSMCDLTQDGCFSGSNGAGSGDYSTLRFNGGKTIIVDLASYDWVTESYSVNGNPCSEAEFNLFMSSYEQKASATWTELAATPQAPTIIYTETPYYQAIKEGEPIYHGPGYHFAYNTDMSEDGVYTIMEECADEEGHLWGRLKAGTGWVDLTHIRENEY